MSRRTALAALPFAAALAAGAVVSLERGTGDRFGLPFGAGLAGAAPAGDGGEPRWHRTAGEAIAEADATGRLILVDLTAQWCGWCRRLDRETFADPGFRAWAAERFVLLRVDVEDGGEGARLRERFQVRGLPTTVIADRRLARVGLVHGFQGAPAMIRHLEAELERHRLLVADYERTLAAGDPAALAAFAARFHERGDGLRAAAVYERLLAAGAEPPGGRARLELALADARRLALDFDGAERALAAARASARAGGGAPQLAEGLALLEVLLARDRGDCERATAAVESLLARHPKSRASVDAIAALKSLESDPAAGCT
jgi:thioredoxin-like negative regulator of GroEL